MSGRKPPMHLAALEASRRGEIAALPRMPVRRDPSAYEQRLPGDDWRDQLCSPIADDCAFTELVGGLCGGSIAWSAAWLWRHSRAAHRQRQERYPDWEPSPLWEGYRDPPGWWSDPDP